MPKCFGILAYKTSGPPINMRADRSKNGLEHRVSQNACVRIVTGAVITVEKDRTVEFMGRAMRERVGRERFSEAFDHRIMGNATERDNGLEPFRPIDGFFKKGSASFDLGRSWLVLRRYAPHRIGDLCTN